MKVTKKVYDENQLPYEADIRDYLKAEGSYFRDLEEFMGQFEDNDGLMFRYPLCDGDYLGFVLVVVREGFLWLPYNAVDSTRYERLLLEKAELITKPSDFQFYFDEWNRFFKIANTAIEEVMRLLVERKHP